MNKHELILIFLMLIMSYSAFSQYDKEFVCYSEDQRCGLLSPEGDTIIPFKFQNISRVYSSYYLTNRKIDGGRKENFKMCIFNLQGKKILPGNLIGSVRILKINAFIFTKTVSRDCMI